MCVQFLPISKLELKRWLADSTCDCHIAKTASMWRFLAAKRRPPQGRLPWAVQVLQFACKKLCQNKPSLPLRPNHLVWSLLPIARSRQTPFLNYNNPEAAWCLRKTPTSPLQYETMTAAPKLHPMGGHRPWWPYSNHGDVVVQGTQPSISYRERERENGVQWGYNSLGASINHVWELSALITLQWYKSIWRCIELYVDIDKFDPSI